ncbi:MAG: FAD-binding protein [Deferribacterales bacterium]
MSLYSWGNYPRLENRVIRYTGERRLAETISKNSQMISYGNGRSYGDSALGDTILHMRNHDLFISFDDQTGLLRCKSGVLLSEILDVFVPRGWFLKITPGTKLITIGGAIASDVHGKNHHVEGCFSECVLSFRIMTADGDIINCSREENADMFHATCGGMGLTGIILEADIYLKKINSKNIVQTTVKTSDLKATFDAFSEYKHMPYSVAWIDCLAKGSKLGRCLLMAGDFADDGDLTPNADRKKDIPFNFPSFSLNNLSVSAFNTLYYAKGKNGVAKVDYDQFFYPLDAINNWNRIYGRNGFTQYQFILPLDASYEGLEKILKKIADSGKGSFLAVLKLYGKANENWLSFPMEGYSLALDFKIEHGLFDLLYKLDRIVLDYGGRIYLTKDVRVPEKTFEQGYPMIDKFRELREQTGMNRKFSSLQSRRVNI